MQMGIVYNCGNLVNPWEEVMQEISGYKEELLARITKIVEHLMKKDTSYQYYLDKNKAIQMIFKYYSEKVSIEELKAMSDFKLTGFVEADMMTLLLIEGEEDIDLKSTPYG